MESLELQKALDNNLDQVVDWLITLVSEIKPEVIASHVFVQLGTNTGSKMKGELRTHVIIRLQIYGIIDFSLTQLVFQVHQNYHVTGPA